jgi:D-alanyl-D-alanine dipeptidase/carboxypeptidase
MMKTIELEKKKIYVGALLLVNKDHPLKDNNTSGLIPADEQYPDILIKRDAAMVLRRIFEKISAGKSIVPVSGYRSSKEQTAIYDGSIKDNGVNFTRKYVALPNHSEHQTGLAIDLGLNKKDIDFIRPDFPYNGICEEFRKTAPDYGFIERYAEDKEELTGISHEPWHFRYVGYPHSKIIEKNGFSLEEYIEFVKSYRDDCRLLYKQGSGAAVEIYYLPASNEKNRIVISENSAYQISGNNIDGFIVTVWRKENG